jgi:hypothetical protein
LILSIFGFLHGAGKLWGGRTEETTTT